MRLLLLAIPLILVSCLGKNDTVTIPQNGHSIVTHSIVESDCTITDFYIDLDDSKSVTEGDEFQSSVKLCNGASGLNGSNGTDGVNGHSLVSETRAATLTECANNGEATDIYLDTDDTLNVSENDVFMNSMVSCNGAAGPPGAAGVNGVDGVNGQDAVIIVARIPNSGSINTSCVLVSNTTRYIRKSSASPTNYNVDVYETLANCTAASSRLARINSGTNEFFWVTSNVLVTTETEGSITYVKVLKF